MLRKIILLTSIVLSLQAKETILNFYRSALENLQYDQKAQQLQQANNLGRESVILSRFANFSLDAAYASTKADRLANPFNTTDISFNDTIDIFGKSVYKINDLALNLQEQRTLLKKQKEELFISLAETVSAYRQAKEQLLLHTAFLNDQLNVLDKIKHLNSSGAVSDIDYLRLKNSIALLKTQVLDETSQVNKMQKQLMLYTKNSPVPSFDENETLQCSKEEYIHADPNQELNSIAAESLMNQAHMVSHDFIPQLTAGTSYQKIDDPTANGDNYSFHIGMSIPLDSGVVKQSEALRAQALSVRSNAALYRVQREKEYIQRVEDIDNATAQLQLLKENLSDSLKSKKVIQEAFLKRYVDFNTYTQVLSQTLSLQEQMIKMRYLKYTETAILNAVASGAIYE